MLQWPPPLSFGLLRSIFTQTSDTPASPSSNLFRCSAENASNRRTGPTQLGASWPSPQTLAPIVPRYDRVSLRLPLRLYRRAERQRGPPVGLPPKPLAYRTFCAYWPAPGNRSASLKDAPIQLIRRRSRLAVGFRQLPQVQQAFVPMSPEPPKITETSLSRLCQGLHNHSNDVPTQRDTIQLHFNFFSLQCGSDLQFFFRTSDFLCWLGLA